MKKIALFVIVVLFILGFSNEANTGQLTLAWDKNTDPEVTGYNLYYGTSSGVYNYNTNAGNVDHYTQSGLDPGYTYFFVATAYGSGQESDYSNEVSAYVIITSVISNGTLPSIWTKVSGTPTEPIESVFDPALESEVLEFSGQSATTYVSNKISIGLCVNSFTVKLLYLLATDSYIIVDATTSYGPRRIIYRPIDTPFSGTATSTNIQIGIGSAIKTSGSWTSISRNLQSDLSLVQPGNNMQRIDTIWVNVKGAGPAIRLDNLETYNVL